jgi:hypothetical protein
MIKVGETDEEFGKAGLTFDPVKTYWRPSR